MSRVGPPSALSFGPWDVTHLGIQVLEVLLWVFSHINELIYSKAFRAPTLWLVPETEDIEMTEEHFPAFMSYSCLLPSRSRSKRWIGEIHPALGPCHVLVEAPRVLLARAQFSASGHSSLDGTCSQMLAPGSLSTVPTRNTDLAPFILLEVVMLPANRITKFQPCSDSCSFLLFLSNKPSPHLWVIIYFICFSGNMERGVGDHHLLSMENFPRDIVWNGLYTWGRVYCLHLCSKSYLTSHFWNQARCILSETWDVMQ